MIQFWRKTSQQAALVAALFFLFAFFLFSCRKYSDDIGFDLLPNTGQYDGIIADSFSIKTFTVRADSVKVDSLNSNIVGAINDPLFGTTAVSLYTQCLLQEINIDFGSTPKLDSIVLSLAIDQNNNSYGKASSKVEFDIYRMAELLKSENRYYSNYQPAIGKKIGNWSGTMRSTDTTWFKDKGKLTYTKGLIRLPLDKSFGEEFFTANAYGSNELFLSFLNGIAIVPKTDNLTSGEGRIAAINLKSVSSKLVIYFNDSLQKEFVISDQSERTMNYSVKNRTATLTNQLNNGGIHYPETYIQATGYCKTKIQIPALLDLVKDGNKVLINEAKLTLTIKEGTTSDDFPAPKRLLLFQAKKDGNNISDSLIIDLVDAVAPPSDSWIGYSNYGGSLNSDGKTYTFRFNRHLQRLLDEYLLNGIDNNRGFYVVIPSDNPITPSRVVLDTRNDMSVQNIGVKITYTKL